MDAAAPIRRFVVSTFLFGDAGALPSDDSSLLEEGLIDSTDVLELVTFLESELGVQVADEEIVPANFDSVARLARYVEAKRRPSGLGAVARRSA
jgi:acyl carrier protein